MIIGFEGKRAVCNSTGLGNYSRLLIEELSEYFPQHQYHIYSPNKDNQHRLADLLKRKNVSLHLPRSAPLGKNLWRSIYGLSTQGEHDGVDILHGLSAELPLDSSQSSLKTVVTIHDLIYCHYPSECGIINNKIYKFKCRHACNIADRIIAVSECTKRDIIQFFGIPDNKVNVIYQGCSPRFSEPISRETIDAIKLKYSLPERYFLNVGTIVERKNALLIVKALELIDDKTIPLIIVGRKTKYTNLIDCYARQHGLAKRVLFLNDVPTHHLPAIYHQATAFVYPSKYEGFGIPVIEAQTCGIPVIVATGSSLLEAAGLDAMSVNPESVDEMVESLNLILRDESLRLSLIERGKENIKRFEPKKLAQEMMTIYQNLLLNG